MYSWPNTNKFKQYIKENELNIIVYSLFVIQFFIDKKYLLYLTHFVQYIIPYKFSNILYNNKTI